MTEAEFSKLDVEIVPTTLESAQQTGDEPPTTRESAKRPGDDMPLSALPFRTRSRLRVLATHSRQANQTSRDFKTPERTPITAKRMSKRTTNVGRPDVSVIYVDSSEQTKKTKELLLYHHNTWVDSKVHAASDSSEANDKDPRVSLSQESEPFSQDSETMGDLSLFMETEPTNGHVILGEITSKTTIYHFRSNTRPVLNP